MRTPTNIVASAGGLALLALGTLSPIAGANDAKLVRAHRSGYPAAEIAAQRASGPEGVQSAYDATRDLQEALFRSAPVSDGCRPLLVSLSQYAAGRILQYEGVDRPSGADVSAGRATAERARPRVSTAARSCRGAGGGSAPRRLAISPSDGEVFYGAVVAAAPRGADAAELFVNGRRLARAPVSGARVRFPLRAAAGRYDLRVTFSGPGGQVGAARSRGAWLLGAGGRRSVPGSRTSAALTAALARATSGGPRFRAAWVQDLSTGESAGVNAGSAFPAASTVKLGLMAGAIARLGPAPETSPYSYDLRAMAAWSSNLATNRILRRLGGAATAAEGLRRLEARASTFPGEYIVGTALQPALPGAASSTAPPRVSRRVTTAQDLARMLYGIHASAAGAPGARGRTGLSAHQARLLLGWLLSSQQRGDNTSLLADGAGGAPIAQKNGWINDARLGAGIIYAPSGPVMAVIATYDDGGVSLSGARSLGARVARVIAR